MKFYVYILKCNDETLYTGSTKDLNNRMSQHNSNSNGAKYTRCRRPCEIIFSEEFNTRSEAIQRELEIKKFSRQKKLELIESLK